MYASATVDIGDVEQGLAAMERRTRTLGPVFAALKKPMKADQQEHRKDKSGPDGSWAPRAASTSHDGKRKLARPILGRLPSAVSYKASPTGVTGESRVAWSGAHEDGAVVGHGARLPARVFLWLSDKLLEVAVEAIDKALIAAYEGGR